MRQCIWKHTILCNKGVFSFVISVQLWWPIEPNFHRFVIFHAHVGIHQVRILVLNNYRRYTPPLNSNHSKNTLACLRKHSSMTYIVSTVWVEIIINSWRSILPCYFSIGVHVHYFWDCLGGYVLAILAHREIKRISKDFLMAANLVLNACSLAVS